MNDFSFSSVDPSIALPDSTQLSLADPKTFFDTSDNLVICSCYELYTIICKFK